MYVYISEKKRALKVRIEEHERNSNSQSVIKCHKDNYYYDFAKLKICYKQKNHMFQT